MIKRSDEMLVELRNQVRGGKGSVELVHIFDGQELKGPAKIIARLKLNPGCSVGKHYHENEEEIYYIMKGSGEADDNGNIRSISEGDAMITGDGAYHAISNTGNIPMEIFALVLLY